MVKYVDLIGLLVAWHGEVVLEAFIYQVPEELNYMMAWVVLPCRHNGQRALVEVGSNKTFLNYLWMHHRSSLGIGWL